MREYQIGMLWIGGPLSFLEILAIRSFIDAGHHVKFFSYGDVPNIPDGVEVCDANTVLSADSYLSHNRTGSFTLHADLFRYHMLAQNDRLIWVDTDAYCLKPFKTGTGHYYAFQARRSVGIGVIGLPSDSEALGLLLEYTRDEYAIPDWFGAEYRAQLEEAYNRGEPVHVSDQPWGAWGPAAFTYFLNRTGEIRHALPREILYPFRFNERLLMLRRGYDVHQHITEDTTSIHFYGHRMRVRIARRHDGIPPVRGLIGRLLKKHGIDPGEAPIRTGLPAKRA